MNEPLTIHCLKKITHGFAKTSALTIKFCDLASRVTPCAPFRRPIAGGGAHGVTRTTTRPPGHVSKLLCRWTWNASIPVGGGTSCDDLAQCERCNSHELPPRRLRTWLSALQPVLVAGWLILPPLAAEAQPAPLIQAHAHNDYEHARPLLDALEHGFCSVEADIWLVDGKLLVAHDRDNVKPARTLQALYLEPLRERVKKNGGRVFPNGPEFTLLIDLKSNWQTIYPVLRGVLTDYSDMLTTFRDGAKRTNAVMVIISGSRDRKMFEGETTRYAGFDGELGDLDANPSPNFAPWISARWGSSFSWRGDGPMPDAERQKLTEIVKRAHEQGRRVRFWGAPDNREFWQMLHTARVDLINTDDLPGLQKFLIGQ